MEIESPNVEEKDVPILKEGMESEFWKIISKFISFDIKVMEKEIRDRGEDMEEKELKRLILRLTLNEALLSYPETLLKSLPKEEDSGIKDDHDPYPQHHDKDGDN